MAVCGTRTLSKLTRQVPEAQMPSFFSGLATDRPGVLRSTMKHVMPL